MIKSEKKNSIKDPVITVIITAHDRKEFLKYAILSVLNQSLDKSLYEIIVIKNFEDDEIDRTIEENGILNLKSTKNSLIGEDLYYASKSAAGEILCFLDDDDMFSSDKLEKVYNIFYNDKSIIYYHNSQQSSHFSRQDSNAHVLFKKIFTHEELIRNLPRFIRTYGSSIFFFNLSSISIRKCAYFNYLNFLHKLSIHQDDFFFFVGLEIGGKFYFDDLSLTIYRIHSSNTSIIKKDIDSTNNSYFKKRSNLFENYAEATHYILSISDNKDIKKFLKCREILELFQMNFYRNKISFYVMIRTFVCSHCNGFKYTIWLVLYLMREKRGFL